MSGKKAKQKRKLEKQQFATGAASFNKKQVVSMVKIIEQLGKMPQPNVLLNANKK